MTELPLSLRLAWRVIRRRPAQPLVAAIATGIAVGAAGLMIAAVYNTVLRPLPYRDADRVFVIRGASDLLSGTTANLVRRSATSFDLMSAYREQALSLRDAERTRRAAGTFVDSAFFNVLGVRASVGRTFDAADVSPAAPPAVVVSHAFAQRWGTVSAAIGHRIVLEGSAYTIVGVMPGGFTYPGTTEVWLPARDNDALSDLEQFWLLGRVRSGTSASRASSELALLSARAADGQRGGVPIRLHADPLSQAARAGTNASFWMFACAIALLFALTAGTLGNLFLVRAVARTHEVAVHAALGGSGVQLVRQQIAESGLIVGAGVALGCVLIGTGSRVLPRLSMRQEWWPTELPIDWHVMLAIGAVAAVLAAFLGVLPLLHFRTMEIGTLLRGGAAGVTSGGAQRRWRSALVCAEISLVMFLVIATAVLAKSYLATERIDWVYDARHTLFGTVMLPQPRFDSPAAREQTAAAVEAALHSIPGAHEVAVFGESYPAWVPAKIKVFSEVDGYSGSLRYGPAGPLLTVDTDSAFFEAMGTRIVRGRGLISSDRAGAAPVIVIDERLAAANWPGQNPLGHHIRFPGMEPGGPWYTVVGVAKFAPGVSGMSRLMATGAIPRISVAYRSRSQVTVRWPGDGNPSAAGFAFAIHTSGDPHALLPAVQRALAASAPDQPLEHLGTLEEFLNADGIAVRGTTSVLAALGAFGVLLCLVGIIGLVSETVLRRTREIGIRIALGASRKDVVALVLHDTSKLACIGVVAGLVVAAALARVAGHLIFARGIGIDDPPVVFGSAVGVLLLVLGATLWPASRALRVDPVVSLRSE